jgi:predicted  nucleic acid-binding Zn-ribbon protein
MVNPVPASTYPPTNAELANQIIRLDTLIPTLATKADLQQVRVEIQEVRVEVQEVRVEVQSVRAEVHDLRAEVHGVRAEVHDVRAEVAGVRTEVHQLRADMFKGFSRMLAWLMGSMVTLMSISLGWITFLIKIP